MNKSKPENTAEAGVCWGVWGLKGCCSQQPVSHCCTAAYPPPVAFQSIEIQTWLQKKYNTKYKHTNTNCQAFLQCTVDPPHVAFMSKEEQTRINTNTNTNDKHKQRVKWCVYVHLEIKLNQGFPKTDNHFIFVAKNPAANNKKSQ